jgi:hypothetical protein
MNYKVGDTVVCIDSLGTRDNLLVVGKQYTVAYIKHLCVGVEGIFDPYGIIFCHRCGQYGDSISHFHTWRFIKLDGLKQDQTTEKEVSA